MNTNFMSYYAYANFFHKRKLTKNGLLFDIPNQKTVRNLMFNYLYLISR